MLNSTPDEIGSNNFSPASLPPVEPTRLETFSKTASAAKMSGTYHEIAGFIKRTVGRLSDNMPLEADGKNQQLIGKVHHLVGSLRSAHNAVLQRINRTRQESQAVFREHGGRFLDGASQFVDDIKKAFLK